MVSRGRRVGHDNEKTGLQKGFRNSLEKRPDFVSAGLAQKAMEVNGGVPPLGFSNIRPVDDVFA